MIYQTAAPPGMATLVADRATWDATLARYPERARGDERETVQRIRAAIVAALATDGGVVRVTLAPDDARHVLGG